MQEKLGINDFILKCWEIEEGWEFELYSDMWWEVRAISETLGEFRGVSLNPFDVEETLNNVLDEIRGAKEKNK